MRGKRKIPMWNCVQDIQIKYREFLERPNWVCPAPIKAVANDAFRGTRTVIAQRLWFVNCVKRSAWARACWHR
jgi:hypothetical protein